MADLGALAVKVGKIVVNFIIDQIKNYLASEQFKKQMEELISTMVMKMVKVVIKEHSLEHNKS